MSESRLVEVYRAKDGIEANLIRIALENAGIRVRIEGELLHGVTGEVPTGWMTSPRIIVFEDDAEKAAAIIRSLQDH